MKFLDIPCLLFVLTLHVQIQDGTCDECTSYTDLQDLPLRHPYNVHDPNTTALSDNIGFVENWYRAGDLDMPNTQAEVNRCGTAWPLYLENPVPQTRTVQENRACLGDVYDKCYYYVNIKVKNCGTYRVYKLKPVGFNDAAYCFRTCSTCNLISSTTSTMVQTTTETTESPNRKKKDKHVVCLEPLKFGLVFLSCFMLSLMTSIVVFICTKKRYKNTIGREKNKIGVIYTVDIDSLQKGMQNDMEYVKHK